MEEVNQDLSTIRQGAVTIYDGMEEIIRNQMLVNGTYVTYEVVNPELAKAGSICGGRQACMVGSMWLAAGVELEIERDPFGEDQVFLPGTLPHEQHEFTWDRPALRLAFTTMNEVCWEHMRDVYGVREDELDLGHAMEEFFEGACDTGNNVTDDELLGLLAEARRRVSA